MKRLILLSAILFLFTYKIFSQDTSNTSIFKPIDSVKRSNPIIYGGADLGAGLTGVKGFAIGISVNYQAKRHLFTARYMNILDLDVKAAVVTPLLVLPGIRDNGSLEEAGVLYGRRFIKGGRAYSLSAGISASKRIINYKDNNNQTHSIEDHYAGIPFELNVMWFKAKKERFRIYSIFPVGKPTGLGNSIGIKLAGNLSQHSFLSIGVTSALGYHRQY